MVASKRLFAGVYTHVDREVPLLVGTKIAILASKRLLSGMH